MAAENFNTDFDPNGPGVHTGNFIGLPYTEEQARVVLLPVPWDATTSYKPGTSNAPDNILQSSYQLDLIDPFVPDAWKRGLYMRPTDVTWKQKNDAMRPVAKRYIDFLESGGNKQDNPEILYCVEQVNQACIALNEWVYNESKALLNTGKYVGLIGGDHSCPLGYIKALTEKHPSFGILQIDAHMDLRKAYEDFTYSHASIFYNVLKLKSITKLVQVGIRDYCDAEVQLVNAQNERVTVFYERDIKQHLYTGGTFTDLCKNIVSQLPELVYISFDIDGLDPKLCPNTGTPVPGGLQFYEALFLIHAVQQSGRTIIGFDLCEVAGEGAWDGNVGARMAYHLANVVG